MWSWCSLNLHHFAPLQHQVTTCVWPRCEQLALSPGILHNETWWLTQFSPTGTNVFSSQHKLTEFFHWAEWAVPSLTQISRWTPDWHKCFYLFSYFYSRQHRVQSDAKSTVNWSLVQRFNRWASSVQCDGDPESSTTWENKSKNTNKLQIWKTSWITTHTLQKLVTVTYILYKQYCINHVIF